MLAETQQFKQINFLNSPMERLLALDQIRYHKPISIVKEFFDFYMQLRVQGPVRIIPNYPNGWFAEVLSEDKIWTVECDRGELRLLKVGDLIDHTQNGGYVTAAEENISGNMYYPYQQICEYRGEKVEPILCRDFCDNGEYDEFRCRCCPWVVTF